MDELFLAMYALFEGSGLAAILAGGLHNTEAPQGTSCPYGVFSLDGWTPHDRSLDRVVIRVDLYSQQEAATEIASLHKALLALYNGALLAAELEGKNLGLDLEHHHLVREENYWRAITTFAVAIVTD